MYLWLGSVTFDLKTPSLRTSPQKDHKMRKHLFPTELKNGVKRYNYDHLCLRYYVIKFEKFKNS